MKRVLILFGLVVMLSGAVAQVNPAQTLAPHPMTTWPRPVWP